MCDENAFHFSHCDDDRPAKTRLAEETKTNHDVAIISLDGCLTVGSGTGPTGGAVRLEEGANTFCWCYCTSTSTQVLLAAASAKQKRCSVGMFCRNASAPMSNRSKGCGRSAELSR
jgi:hypothetical protein